ncbi:hypothetical protein [Aequorivita echinoideorum]|uniref:Phenylalanyl-tRNA synthetase subunit alpha n=1 Tax=Aequorivita echinoideorum TaxID=1549647 RepID=A0ABS5S3X0_9FLAO|nr:hypothetical protein [Aequorivita echinoideorum]MBT0607092.1 hypothetical protein [Aequorivita echinoideorum]
MRKDIEIPKAKNVHIVAVKEWDKDFTGQQWNVYVINNREDAIDTVLVMSRGASEDRKTATLRHNMGTLQPKTASKVEFITTEVLGFTNEYLLTFFAENKLFERKFTFAPHSIFEENAEEIPVLEVEGILAR